MIHIYPVVPYKTLCFGAFSPNQLRSNLRKRTNHRCFKLPICTKPQFAVTVNHQLNCPVPSTLQNTFVQTDIIHPEEMNSSSNMYLEGQILVLDQLSQMGCFHILGPQMILLSNQECSNSASLQTQPSTRAHLHQLFPPKWFAPVCATKRLCSLHSILHSALINTPCPDANLCTMSIVPGQIFHSVPNLGHYSPRVCFFSTFLYFCSIKVKWVLSFLFTHQIGISLPAPIHTSSCFIVCFWQISLLKLNSLH